MKTEDLESLNEKIAAMFAEVMDDPTIAKFHGPNDSNYKSIRVDVTFGTDVNPRCEWMLYAGGCAPELMGCVYGNSVPEVFNKIAGFDPEEKERRQIAALKEQLEKLEHPVAVAPFENLESAVRI